MSFTKHPNYDFIVIGGGIAGASVACELANKGRTLLLETESQLAYHTTARSVAISMESYGNANIRALTLWSSKFLKSPPDGFSSVPLWRARGALIVADAAMANNLKERISAIRQTVPSVSKVNAAEIAELAPYLNPADWACGLYEPDAFDLDVHAIFSAFISNFTRRGGEVARETEFMGASRSRGAWQVDTRYGSVQGKVIINAAGAWSDQVAERAGLEKCGLKPLRRTVVHVETEKSYPASPYLGTVDEQLFIKPEGNSFLISPCDETPSPACDSAPEELDVAIAMDRLLNRTRLQNPRLASKWAGLRTFTPDRTPVIGPDPDDANFIWFAGLGGYGIQAGPAMAKICAAFALGERAARSAIKSIAGENFNMDDLLPLRCRASRARAQDIKAVAELR